MLDLEDFLGNDDHVFNTDDPEFKVDGDSNPQVIKEDGDEDPKEDPKADPDEEDGFELQDDPRKTEGDPKEGEDNKDKNKEGDDPAKSTPAVAPASEISLIETFLESYNVVGGELETADGAKVLFKDLTPEQQLSALNQIVGTDPTGLGKVTDEELQLIKTVRESKMTVTEFMTKSATEFSDMQAASQIYDAEEYKFETMNDDLIYSTYILANNPDVTEEILQQEIEHAKKSPLYASTVTALRNSFIENRETQRKAYTDKMVATRIEQAEKESVKYVNAAKTVSEIAGWPVSNDDKNILLESFMELDAAGKNKFITEVTENPETAFKAMWFLKYGEENFKKLDAYYKDQVKKVYAKGIEDGKAGKSVSSPRQSGIKPKEEEQTPSGEVSKARSLEEFINR